MQSPQTQAPNPLHPGRGTQNGRPCRACALPHKVLETLDQKLRAGDSAMSVHRWLHKHFPVEGAKVTYGIVAAHHRQHVRLIDRAAAQLSDAERMRRERIKLSRRVLKGEAVDPAVYFAPAAIAQDVAKTTKRLDLAADEAYQSGEHSALAALSNSLLRSAEIRGKMGGSIAERAAEINVTVSLGELHARLDGVLAGPQGDRLSAAATLLGLPPPNALAGASGPASSENSGVPMTSAPVIDGETVATPTSSAGTHVGPATPQPTPPPVMHSRKSSRRTD